MEELMLQRPILRAIIIFMLLNFLLLSYIECIYGEYSNRDKERYEQEKGDIDVGIQPNYNIQNLRENDIDTEKRENKRKEIIEKSMNDIELVIALEYQITEGEQSFKVINSSKQTISKLTYPIKGDLYTLKGEIRFNPKFSIGGKYGSSDFDKTINSDEDWNFIGLHNGELKLIEYQITKQDCKSKMELFDINLYYHILDYGYITENNNSYNPAENRILLDIFAGYQQQKGRYTMRDPTSEYRRIVDGSLWVAVGLPLYEGLDSPYKVRYSGPRLGLRIKGAKKRFSTSMSMAFALIKTRAYGYWNLREYTFSQSGSKLGYALIFELEALYHFNNDWFVGIGYNYRKYRQEKLKESGVQPGSTYDDLDIIRDVDLTVYGPSFIVGKIW